MAGPVVERPRGPDVGQAGIAVERLRFLTGAPPGRLVRAPIRASWQRSLAMRVAADDVDPFVVADPELDTPLTRAADPVLHGLATALEGQPICVVLTDRHGLVLRRLTTDARLAHRLDRAALAPGSVYAEEVVGTNGIGTALEIGAAVYVSGHEHFAEHLEDLACAGLPIRHPMTGRTVGVLDLTCWQRNVGALLPVLAATTAAQVQAALTTQSARHERELLDEYLRECRHSDGAVLAVGPTVDMLNDRARETLTAVEQGQVMHLVREALRDPGHRHLDLALPDGQSLRLRLHAVGDPGPTRGLVARVLPHRGGSAPHPKAPTSRPLPGLVGAGPLWLRACTEVEQAFLAEEWLVVAGEEGSGRLAVLRAVQLRRHPVPHLTVLDAAGAPGEVLGGLREALGRTGGSIVLHRPERLPAVTLRAAGELLRGARSGPGPRPWVAVTTGEESGAGPVAGLGELLVMMPTTVSLPPLRLHADDVPALVQHFSHRSQHAASLDWSPDSLRLLRRAAWPGNVAQLQQVVRDVVARHRAGTVLPEHLPAELRSSSRRALYTLEALEREAIMTALLVAHGDKNAAAEALGMSRATIYRRIRSFGIPTETE